MKISFAAAALALILGISLTACSSSTSSANSADSSATSAASDDSASTDNSASSSSDTSSSSATAASGLNGVAVYPGATAGTMPSSMGSPPPDAKTFVTSDDLKKVQDWYTTNVKGSKVVMSDPKMGTMLLVGDPKTGTAVLLASSGGKTYIGMTSAANVK